MQTDQEIMEMLFTNPEKGLSLLMKNYTGYVFTIVHGRLSGSCKPEDIEECVSDVFYEAYQNRRMIDLTKGSVKAYLSVLAKRNAVDVYRKLRHDRDLVPMDEGLMETLSSESDPCLDAAKKDASDRLIKEIKALGEPDTQIMIRKYYFGQSSKEIAKALLLKANTVDKRVSRALAKLKETLGGVLYGE